MKTKRILAFLFIATFMLSFSAAAVAQGELEDDRDTVYTYDFQIPARTDIMEMAMLFDSPEGKMITLSGKWDVSVPLTVTVYRHASSIIIYPNQPIFSGEIKPDGRVTFPIYEAGTYRIEIAYNGIQKLTTAINGTITVVVPYLSSF